MHHELGRGFPRGIVYSDPITSRDLLPTIAAVVGAEQKADIDYDGKDLLPYLKIGSSKNTTPNETLYSRWRGKMAMRSRDYKWLDA